VRRSPSGRELRPAAHEDQPGCRRPRRPGRAPLGREPLLAVTAVRSRTILSVIRREATAISHPVGSPGCLRSHCRSRRSFALDASSESAKLPSAAPRRETRGRLRAAGPRRRGCRRAGHAQGSIGPITSRTSICWRSGTRRAGTLRTVAAISIAAPSTRRRPSASRRAAPFDSAKGPSVTAGAPSWRAQSSPGRDR